MEKTVCFGCGEKYIPNQLTHDEIFLRLALDMSDDPHCDKDKIWHEYLKKSLLEVRKNGEIINTFHTTLAASQSLNTDARRNIIDVCKGKRKSAYGYIWKYVNLV